MPQNPTPGQNEVRFWLNEIKASQDRERNWRRKAESVIDVYEGEDKRENSFNILYSNTETLAPALYNNPPGPSLIGGSGTPIPWASRPASRQLGFSST